jgi:uncharacterized protein (TIGR00369 family)
MDEVLKQWLDDEAQVRARSAHRAAPGAAAAAPLAGLAGLAGLSGLQQLQRMVRGETPFASIGHTMDFLLVEVAEGLAVFQGAPGPAHFNPMGGVHGGWYATLLDSALGCCVHTRLPAGKAYTTLELKVNFVRAVGPSVQRVRATGRVIHLGGQIATSEARLEGPDGKLYAHGTTTCLIFDAQPKAAAPKPEPLAKFES